jgi:hypothetical protein
MPGKKPIDETIAKMDEGFLTPFYEYLDTGVNKIKKLDYLAIYDLIVYECDKYDNAEKVHNHCIKIVTDFCTDRMVKEMIDLKEDQLLL